MCGTENGSAGVAPHPVQNNNPATSVYSQVQDYLSNTNRYKYVRSVFGKGLYLTCYRIIESTLREGEQFSNAFFTREHKVKIATMLSDFGVDYIELTSPVSSQGSYDDCKYICSLGLKVGTSYQRSFSDYC
jgi:homocitrate synthase